MGEEILQVTADGRFLWHDNADELIEKGELRFNPGMQHLLRRLRRASAVEAAAQQALDALEQLQGGCTDSDDGTVEAITVWCPEVIEALRSALAQEQAGPVQDKQP